MKKTIGTLLSSAGHAINLLTLAGAFIYAAGAVSWLHAPVLDVLQVTATMAALPLGLAWLCRIAGRRLRAAGPAPTVPLAKRWLLAGTGIVLALACATAVRTGLREYECSADRSRNADAHEAETRKNGFERVCEGDLARFDISFRPIAAATRKLAFTPVDLAHTPFARLEPLGGRAEYVSEVPSRLYRGFRMPDGHRLTLFEQDMSADGTTAWRDPKDEQERIKGLPARLVVLQAPSGGAVSLLSWKEGRRDYQLWVDANVVREPLRAQLFALAASLPQAIPACPKEPPRPAGEPLPRVLTQAQLEAIADRSKRPCR